MTSFKGQLTYWQVKERLLNITDIEQQACTCCLYGFGCRISELLGNPKAKQQGLTKQELWVEDREDKHLLKASLWNEKQKREEAMLKTCMINLDREAWLTAPILAWKEQCQTDKLFHKSRTWWFLKVKELVGFNPHYFRKARITQYLNGQVTGRPESIETVRKLIGSSSQRTMIEHYSQVSTIDVERMV